MQIALSFATLHPGRSGPERARRDAPLPEASPNGGSTIGTRPDAADRKLPLSDAVRRPHAGSRLQAVAPTSLLVLHPGQPHLTRSAHHLDQGYIVQKIPTSDY
jgi:hypothetical protein